MMPAPEKAGDCMGKEKIATKRGTTLFTNKLGKFERISVEEMKIVFNRVVPGLMPVETIDKRGKITLQVNVTGWTPLTAYFTAGMNSDTALTFIWHTARIAHHCERYGLRVDSLCWSLDQVFVDPQGNIAMVYWPVTTLEQKIYTPLTFYYSFAGILSRSRRYAKIGKTYLSYFYQRSEMDFSLFYDMVKMIVRQWNDIRKNAAGGGSGPVNTPDPSYPMIAFTGKLVRQSESLVLDRKSMILGRDSKCDVVIKGFDGLSRQHARIENEEGEYYLTDLNSSNGTFINGKRQEPNQRTLLCNGDEIRFGNATYVFNQPDRNQTISIHQVNRS